MTTATVTPSSVPISQPTAEDGKLLLPPGKYVKGKDGEPELQLLPATDSPLETHPKPRVTPDKPEFVYNVNDTSTIPAPRGKTPKSFIDIVRDGVPSLSAPNSDFQPIWFLPDGDLQTMFSVNVGPTEEELKFERKLIMVPDGGNLALDFCPPLSTYKRDDKTPIVLMLHGLLGGSHAGYVRCSTQELVKPKSKGGPEYRTVTMTLRGCNGTKITSPHFYHPGMTHDIKSSLLYLDSVAPDVQIYGIGFSLGAGLLTNYLGETGENSRLTAGYAVSNVWDYCHCYNEFTSGSLISRFVYNTTLGQRHRLAIYKNRRAFVSPSALTDGAPTPPPKLNHNVSIKHTPEAVARIHDGLQSILYDPVLTMSEFTTRFLFKTSGYETFDEFHTKTSSTQFISRIKVPLLCLTSRDDPLMRERNLPLKEISESSHVVLGLTRKGGHLGWFKHAPDGSIVQWYTDSANEFFVAMNEYNPAPGKAARVTPPDQYGMVYDYDDPTVGFKVVDQEYIDAIELPQFKAPFSVMAGLLEFYMIGPDALLAGLLQLVQFITNIGKHAREFINFLSSIFTGRS